MYSFMKRDFIITLDMVLLLQGYEIFYNSSMIFLFIKSLLFLKFIKNIEYRQ